MISVSHGAQEYHYHHFAVKYLNIQLLKCNSLWTELITVVFFD